MLLAQKSKYRTGTIYIWIVCVYITGCVLKCNSWLICLRPPEKFFFFWLWLVQLIFTRRFGTFEIRDGQIVWVFMPVSVCHESCTTQRRFLDHTLDHKAISDTSTSWLALVHTSQLLLLHISAIPLRGVVVEGGNIDEIPGIFVNFDQFISCPGCLTCPELCLRWYPGLGTCIATSS